VIGIVLVLVALLLAELRGGSACHQRIHRNLRRSEVGAGRGFEGTILPVAGGDSQQKKQSQCRL
jgi:hypothetical protein